MEIEIPELLNSMFEDFKKDTTRPKANTWFEGRMVHDPHHQITVVSKPQNERNDLVIMYEQGKQLLQMKMAIWPGDEEEAEKKCGGFLSGYTMNLPCQNPK